MPAQGSRNVCSADGARSDVTRAVHQFGDAFRAGDVAKVDALLHARYLHTNGGSKATSRADWMKWFTLRSRKIEKGELKVLAYELRDVEVEIFSDVAIVTGQVDATTQTPAKTEQSKVRFTHVWLCEAGQWKRSAFHDAPIVDAP